MSELLDCLRDTEKIDVTIVASSEETIELINSLDLSDFDEVHINTEGEYSYVSICNFEDKHLLFVESVIREGEFIMDDTDALIVLESIPIHIRHQLYEMNEYKFTLVL